MDLQETTLRVQSALASETRMLRFRDGDRPDEPDHVPDEVSVLVADGSPAPGFTSYSTLDLARFPTNVADSEGRRVGSELITVGRTAQRAFADVLSRCAFAVAGGSLHVMPLTLIPDAVDAAEPGHTMRHVLLVLPFIWPELEILVEEEATADAPAAVTTWLQVAPISDEEFRYATDHGAQSLFDRLEQSGADVSDLDRDSVI
ncbi:MAG: suppressor of fused domain protein [Tomitella sp.]|nr:suppressor of fused domain protein [Tomitella sp.]